MDVLLITKEVGMSYILKSKRLYARPFNQEDFDLLFSLHGNPEVGKTTIDGVQNKKTVQKHLDKFIAHQDKYGYSQWAIFEKETDNFVGRGGLTTRILLKEIGPETEIRFAIMPDSWGQGYATELAFAIKDFAIKSGMKRMVASSDPKNDASNTILRKIGLKYIKNIIPEGYGVIQEITYNEMEL